jgi:hypothetical protein
MGKLKILNKLQQKHFKNSKNVDHKHHRIV